MRINEVAAHCDKCGHEVITQSIEVLRELAGKPCPKCGSLNILTKEEFGFAERHLAFLTSQTLPKGMAHTFFALEMDATSTKLTPIDIQLDREDGCFN